MFYISFADEDGDDEDEDEHHDVLVIRLLLTGLLGWGVSRIHGDCECGALVICLLAAFGVQGCSAFHKVLRF